MINLKTGEFKLDEYNLIIHPELTLSAFKAGDIPFKERFSTPGGAIWFAFKGSLETLKADFHILFKQQFFCMLSVQLDEKYKLTRGERIEGWFTKISGMLPPFEYEWGCLFTDVGDRDDNSFSVISKYSILDGKGFSDVQSFYKLRNSGSRLKIVLFGEQ